MSLKYTVYVTPNVFFGKVQYYNVNGTKCNLQRKNVLEQPYNVDTVIQQE